MNGEQQIIKLLEEILMLLRFVGIGVAVSIVFSCFTYSPPSHRRGGSMRNRPPTTPPPPGDMRQ